MATFQLNMKMDSTVKDFYTICDTTDSGFDLYVPETVIVPAYTTLKINHKVKCEVVGDAQGYYLYARSSISKTPLICHNSVGVIDYGYRGDIIGAVYNTSKEQWKIEKGTRLFQLCAPDLKPFLINLVNEVTDTERGEGGFGSTGS